MIDPTVLLVAAIAVLVVIVVLVLVGRRQRAQRLNDASLYELGQDPLAPPPQATGAGLQPVGWPAPQPAPPAQPPPAVEPDGDVHEMAEEWVEERTEEDDAWAQARLEAERRIQAQEEVERRARLEAEQRARALEETERLEREEMERRVRAREEAERRAQAEAEQRTRIRRQSQPYRRFEPEQAEPSAQPQPQAEPSEQPQPQAEPSEQPQPQAEPSERPDVQADWQAREAEAQALIDQAEADFREGERKALDEAERIARQEAQKIAQVLVRERARPVRPAEEVAAPEPRPEAPGVTRILLVEDSKTMRTIFKRVFAVEGFVLEALETGDGALEAAHQVRPHLIVIDLTLDDADGYEVCRQIRCDPELGSTPVLLLHGPAVEFDDVRASEVEATDHLAKPFETQDLVDKVCELTGTTPF